MRITSIALTVAATLTLGQAATAKLTVLGDVSILTDGQGGPTNWSFLESVAPAHGSIVIDGPNSTLLARFYNSVGDAAHRITTGANITSSALSGAGLLIEMTPTREFTGAEIKTISAFLHGGGSVLLAGGQ